MGDNIPGKVREQLNFAGVSQNDRVLEPHANENRDFRSIKSLRKRLLTRGSKVLSPHEARGICNTNLVYN